MATARRTSGFGVAPGYGKVTNSKPKPFGSAWGGLAGGVPFGNSHPVFTPQTPSPGGGGAAGGGGFTPQDQSAAPPVDPIYDQTIAGLGRSRTDALAELTRQRGAGLLGYGYNATYDANGLVSGLTYDPNNPYSQAALARTVYQQNKNGTTNSLAARGQLYSGALTNAQNTNDTNFNVGENSRQQALINFLNGLTGQEKGVNDSFDTGSLQAEGDRLGRAPSNPNYNPATPAGGSPAAASSKVDLSKWVKTAYKNPQGHDVRVFGDGHKEVFINGQWKRV